MTVLVRKIERGKWTKHIGDYKGNGLVASYPITNDMKTCDENTLSVWEVDLSDGENLKNVIIAIASTRDKLQNLDTVVLSKKKILEYNIPIYETDGETPLSMFKHYHRDLSKLTIDGISNISKDVLDFVIDNSENPQNYQMRYTKNELIKLFVEKIEDGTIFLESLNESFQKDINKKLNAKKQ